MRGRVAFRALALSGLMAAQVGTASAASPLLPDLEQKAPDAVSVITVPGGRYHLIFGSRVRNRNDPGVGPLIIRAHRRSTSQPMIADQIIRNSDGSETTRPGVGQLFYEVNPTHQHWHYKGFDSFALRRAGDYGFVTSDRKQGFCLPDRVYARDFCARNKPGALFVQEGMSPGFTDRYRANQEGQYLDVTGVPPGDYYLVHWVNQTRSLLERSYADNQAALRIVLGPSGPGDPLTVSTGVALAPFLPPRPLSAGEGRRLVRRALTQYFHRPPQRLRRSCRRKSESSFLCGVRWRQPPYRYRGALRILPFPVGNGFEPRFRLRARRSNPSCISRHCTKTIRSRNHRFD